MDKSVDNVVTETIVGIVEKFDLDFNVGNALLNLLSAEFSGTPILYLEKAIFLLDKRVQVLKNRQENGMIFNPKPHQLLK